MNYKTLFTLFAFSIFAVILASTAFASAAVLDISSVSVPTSTNHDQGSFTAVYNVSYDGVATSVPVSMSSGITSGIATITFNPATLTLGDGTSNPRSLLVNATVSFNSYQRGAFVGTISAVSAGLTTATIPFSVTINDMHALNATNTQETTFIRNGTMTLRNTGNVDLSTITLTSSGDFPLSFVPGTIASLAPGVTSSTIVVVPNPSAVTLHFGTNTATATARASDGTQTTVPFTLQKTFCKAGPQGTNLSIDRVDISSTGDDDLEWKLLDDIEVRVKVENIGSETVREIKVELGLFDSAGRNRINDVEFSSTDEERINLGSLNDGKDDEVTFKFRVPADFDTDSYKLAVKAYSDRDDETRNCVDSTSDLDQNTYQTVTVDNEDEEERFVIVDDIMLPEEVSCGETVSGSFKVFNVGDEDQDQVLITLKNKALALNSEFEIRENLNEGDDKTMDFTFDVPRTAQDGTYTLEFKTFYDYRNGVYRQESTNTFAQSIKVIGCAAGPAPQTSGVAISADLKSDATAGQPLTVTASFRNSGTQSITLSINAEGYDSWASLDSISRRTITLEAGETKTADFTFDVKETVSGAQSFSILANAEGKTTTQDVEVDFGSSESGSGFTFPTGTPLIWIIVIINVVLVALIIVVAVRLARR